LRKHAERVGDMEGKGKPDDTERQREGAGEDQVDNSQKRLGRKLPTKVLQQITGTMTVEWRKRYQKT